MARPIFSGHESFACKSHWLKRGYDFVIAERNFNDDDAVVYLGVGKNMVASIRFWLKSVGLLKEDHLEDISDYLFNDENGRDPYLEDIGTLWLLHFMLVNTEYATIYKTTFVEYHRQRNIIEKDKLQNYIKHTCFEGTSYKNLYNDNTVKRDIGVMLHNYYSRNNAYLEDSNCLLVPLNLISEVDKDTYIFNYDTHSEVPCLIFLYALLTKFENRHSISFEDIAELALIFCLTNNDLLNIIKNLSDLYPSEIVFSDVAGIKELQFRATLNPTKVLDRYYEEN
jgi:hypothetical protein|uniref:DUF4007 family protein n=1 Tax=Bacteroides stercoris TaxID=46506 RepID=UPI003562C5B1